MYQMNWDSYRLVKDSLTHAYKDFLCLKISDALWKKARTKDICKFYPEDGVYVFSRMMHTGNQFRAFQKANHGKATQTTITFPAFPTFLFPPEDIIRKMEESPKLTLEKYGIRVDNWNSIYGKYVCCDKDFNKYDVTLARKEKSGYHGFPSDNVLQKKLIKYLEENGKEKTIYSMYRIERICNKKGKVKLFKINFIGDITKKYNDEWSRKSGRYSGIVHEYYFTRTKYGPISGYYIKDIEDLVKLLMDEEKSKKEKDKDKNKDKDKDKDKSKTEKVTLDECIDTNSIEDDCDELSDDD